MIDDGAERGHGNAERRRRQSTRVDDDRVVVAGVLCQLPLVHVTEERADVLGQRGPGTGDLSV